MGGAAAIYTIFAIMLRFGTLNGVVGCVLAFQVWGNPNPNPNPDPDPNPNLTLTLTLT